MNAASKWASWARMPSASPRLRWTRPRSGSSKPAATRSSVVLPAPFGPTRPTRSPAAIAASMPSRITKSPISRTTPSRRTTDTLAAHRRTSFRPPGRARPSGPLGTLASRSPSLVEGRRPDRVATAQLGPADSPATSGGSRPRHHPAQDPRRTLAVPGGQALAPRAEMGGSCPDDDPPDGPATARTRLARALVDLQLLLHRSIAFGRRVVVDRAPAPLDRLGEHTSQFEVQPSLIGRPQRGSGAQRVQPRGPQRLVGVDVADPREERLVGQQRLEPCLATADQPPEGLEREGFVERLRTQRLEGLAGGVVQPEPPELPDVPEVNLAAVQKLEHKAYVWVRLAAGRDDEKLAGHLQVDRQRRIARPRCVGRQLEDDELRPAADANDLVSRDRLGEALRRVRPNRLRPDDARSDDGRPGDQPAEIAGDGFDLGQLRHAESLGRL